MDGWTPSSWAIKGGILKYLIEFPLEADGSVVIEVDEPAPTGGPVRAARPGEIVAKASETFESALERIRPSTSILLTQLRSLTDIPSEIEVEFGLKLSAEAGAIVASAGGEAHYKITLRWKAE